MDTPTAAPSRNAPYQTYEQTDQIIRIPSRMIGTTENPKNIIGADRLMNNICIYLEDPITGVRTMANCDPGGALDETLVPRVIESFTHKGGNIKRAKCRVFTRKCDDMEPHIEGYVANLVAAVKSKFVKLQTNQETAEQNFKHIHTTSIIDPNTKQNKPLNKTAQQVVLSAPKTNNTFGLNHTTLMIDNPERIDENSSEWKNWLNGMFGSLATNFNFPPAEQLKESPKLLFDPKEQDEYMRETGEVCYLIDNHMDVSRDPLARTAYLLLKRNIDLGKRAELEMQHKMAVAIVGSSFPSLPMPRTSSLSAAATGRTAASSPIGTRWREELRNVQGKLKKQEK